MLDAVSVARHKLYDKLQGSDSLQGRPHVSDETMELPYVLCQPVSVIILGLPTLVSVCKGVMGIRRGKAISMLLYTMSSLQHSYRFPIPSHYIYHVC